MSLPRFEKEWDGFRGHVAMKWDKLSEDDLVKIEGNLSELVTLITGTYGEKKSEVEAKLHELYESYLGAKEKISQGFNDAREDLGARTKDLTDSMKQKAASFQSGAKERMQKIREENIDPAVEKSEEYIKVHPFSAVLGAFGIGVLLGGVIALLSSRGDD
jgi:ElaB/YqjD/DUF883 family membrane-anchored ribosome-binding protein/uncharacterized protein YjbJ (UPF0337 family)